MSFYKDNEAFLRPSVFDIIYETVKHIFLLILIKILLFYICLNTICVIVLKMKLYCITVMRILVEELLIVMKISL